VIHELYADQIVTPSARSGGGLRSYSPGRITFTHSGRISSIEKISKKKLSLRGKKIKREPVIIPGLVDCHTHLVFAGDRAEEWGLRLKGVSYEEIARRGGGIQTTVRATRKASPGDLLSLAKQRLQQSLRCGVTSIEIKSGYGLDLKSELKILKIIQKLKQTSSQQIFSTFLAAHALPPEFAATEEYVDFIIKRMLPKLKNLADFQDVFVEHGYFGTKESVRLLKAGLSYGLKPKVHAHEFGRTGGIRVAAEVGALSAEHLQYVNASDLDLMKKKAIVPVVLPGTSFFLGGSHFAPARKILDAGLPLAIASDFNPGTNPSLNLPMCGSFAAVFESLSLEEILTAQTRNAARALGLRDRGVLDKNYRADFVSLNAKVYEELYYHYGASIVKAVYIGGKKII